MNAVRNYAGTVDEIQEGRTTQAGETGAGKKRLKRSEREAKKKITQE